MVKPKKPTKSPTVVQYEKELKRIKQFISRASKRGFMWEDNVIPARPKRVTKKSVERLKKITPSVLYKKGKFVDIDTGEILPATVGRQIERKKSAEKAAKTRKRNKNKPNKDYPTTPDVPDYRPDVPDYEPEDNYYPEFTDIVISMFQATLNQFPNAEGTQLLLRWLDQLIADNGRGNVAQMLQDGASAGLIVTWETVYKSTDTKTYMTEMMNYLPDQGSIYSEQIMDMMEQIEWWEQPE